MSKAEIRDPVELLVRWKTNVERSHLAHYLSANRYSRIHYWLGVPVVMLTTVVGTAVFASLKSATATSVQICVGLISILAAALASLQTFLKSAERALHHRSTGASFGAIKRQIQEIIATHEESATISPEVLAQVRASMDSLAKGGPEVPNDIWQHVQRTVLYKDDASVEVEQSP